MGDIKQFINGTLIDAGMLEKARSWAEELGEDFLIELIDIYKQDTPRRLAALRQALEQADFEALRREAHTLKSSSAQLGAMEISNMAKDMEALARAGKIDDMDARIAHLTEEYTKLEVVLGALRAAPSEFTSRNA
jgi:two-component system, sensor histidine kinase and response regulator